MVGIPGINLPYTGGGLLGAVPPQQPTGLLGRFGTALGGGNPLFNLALGYLAQVGPERGAQRTSAAQRFGRAAAYASEAQQQAVQNELIRAKLLEQQKALAREEKLTTLLGDTEPPPGSNISPALWKGLVAAAPAEAAKGLFGNLFMSPQDRLATAQLAELTRKGTAETGETVGETVATLGNVKSVGDISETLEDSPLFAPGGVIDQQGWAPVVGGVLRTAKAAGLDIDQNLIDDANDLGILDKATQAMATNLQSVSANLSSSKYALQAVQQAVAAKMPWVAKREVLVTNLNAIFADIDEQGLGDKVPEYEEMKELRDRWAQQNEAYRDRRKRAREESPGEARTLGYSREQGVTSQPPTKAAPPVNPETGEPYPVFRSKAEGERVLKSKPQTVYLIPDPEVPGGYLAISAGSR